MGYGIVLDYDGLVLGQGNEIVNLDPCFGFRWGPRGKKENTHDNFIHSRTHSYQFRSGTVRNGRYASCRRAGTEEAASRTGQDTGRFRPSRTIPAIPGGIESSVHAGTVLEEEDARLLESCCLRPRSS